MLEFEGYHHSAKIILSRFHFVCSGSIPLWLDWDNGKASALANMTPEQIEFMQRTQRAIKEKGKLPEPA
jgi:hypothetical protein